MSHKMYEILKTSFVAWILILLASQSIAELEIEITRGAGKRAPIAIVPFGWEGENLNAPLDVAGVIGADLQRSGRFRVLPNEDMLQKPNTGVEVDFDDWRILGIEVIVVGRVTQTGLNVYSIGYEVYDVFKQERLIAYRRPASRGTLRRAAHRVADRIFEKLTGIQGIFATRIAYVTVEHNESSSLFKLMVSDEDGENERIYRESTDIIMSPAWSPDERRLAYVSFEENNEPIIFEQTLRTGNRIKLSRRKGVHNGAPAYSPDGRHLVLTLGSIDGNLDIYVMNLSNKEVKRLTTDRSIDTEGSWSPDGKQIYFNSDRSGSAQIYRIDSSGGIPERITFEGRQNQRPRLSPDGKKLAMITLDRENYGIGVLDLNNGNFSILPTGNQDSESPSFSPNSDKLIYATRQGQNEVLETVSVDGSDYKIIFVGGARVNVREPVWGPFSRL